MAGTSLEIPPLRSTKLPSNSKEHGVANVKASLYQSIKVAGKVQIKLFPFSQSCPLGDRLTEPEKVVLDAALHRAIVHGS
jgi:hypothetical protein